MKTFLAGFIFSFLFWASVNVFQENMEGFFYAQVSSPLQIPNYFVEIPKKPQKPELAIEAKSAIAAKIQKNGQESVLFEKNSDLPLPIASLTKLMTAIIVLEGDYNPQSVITISYKAAGQGDTPNYGNLKKGEKFTADELLELMLVYSSNDAAFALAESFGGSGFIEKMNDKADDLGLGSTWFFNPNGLDPLSADSQNAINYSTAKDLVKLALYILKEHPLIFAISSKEPLFYFENGLASLYFPENAKLVGGKTGETKESGGNLLFIFRNGNGDVFINAILGADSAESRIKEAQKLIDWINL